MHQLLINAARYTKALDAIKAVRKDRVAELKVDKERLESLSRDKRHSDKLKSRISDIRSAITNKEIEYDETKKSYETMVIANQKFYDSATKFRELYLTIQNLEDRKIRYEAELEEAKESLQEMEGI